VVKPNRNSKIILEFIQDPFGHMLLDHQYLHEFIFRIVIIKHQEELPHVIPSSSFNSLWLL